MSSIVTDVVSPSQIKSFFDLVEKKYRASRHDRAVAACYDLLEEAGYYTEQQGPRLEQQLNELLEDANSETLEILYEYIQAMMSSMLDEARPCMIRLAAYYFRRRQPVDWVYKRVSGLILQASNTDIEQLGRLMAILQRYVLGPPKRRFPPLEITVVDTGEHVLIQVQGDAPDKIRTIKKEVELWAGLDALERSRLTHFSARNREAGMKVTFSGGTLARGLPVLIHVFPPRAAHEPR